MAYVLIIDDDEDFATAAATALQNAGYDAEVMLETGAAMTSIQKKRPDLVILDVMFPEDDAAGFEFARSLRAGDAANIPVLMLTAVNTKFPLGFSRRDIDETWLPVSDFLEKPIDVEVLKEKVASLLSRAT